MLDVTFRWLDFQEGWPAHLPFFVHLAIKNMGARAWPGMNADKEIEILFLLLMYMYIDYSLYQCNWKVKKESFP